MNNAEPDRRFVIAWPKWARQAVKLWPVTQEAVNIDAMPGNAPNQARGEAASFCLL